MPKLAALTKVPMVKTCPRVAPAKGVVRMSSEFIAMLAAAVQDKDEWAIILKGTKSADDMEIDIKSFWVPNQERSKGHVDILPFTPEADDLGVIHSHNTMGARFSTVDRDTLNPRFRLSIVIAQAKLAYLGFDYQAVSKITLPCGATAEIPFFIQPHEGPEVASVVRFAGENVVEDLKDCPHYENGSEDKFHVVYQAACGLEEPVALAANAFGTADTLLKLVEEIPRPKPQPVVIYTGARGLAGLTNSDIQWCFTHKVHDYCEYNQKLRESAEQELGKSNGNGKLTPRGKKGAKHNDRGWLGKYEERFVDKKKRTAKGTCMSPTCAKKVKTGDFCSRKCYDDFNLADRQEQQSKFGLCSWGSCTEDAAKGSLFCSPGCAEAARLAALFDEADETGICINCTKQLGGKGKSSIYFCSPSCYNLFNANGRQPTLKEEKQEKTISTYWCNRCQDWDPFTDGICEYCSLMLCKKCQTGHTENVCYKASQAPSGDALVVETAS